MYRMASSFARVARFCLALSVCSTLAGVGAAQDLTRRAVPQKWVEPLLPEDLPKLEVPEYVTKDAFEKARAEAFAGRYKIALATLHQVKGGDPIEVALVKASALAPLGRFDEALQTLSADKVQADPRAQVAKARVLADMGRNEEAVALLKTHLQEHADSIAGHYWLGRVSERLGDLNTARAAYAFFEPFVDKWQGDRTQFNSAEDVTTI